MIIKALRLLVNAIEFLIEKYLSPIVWMLC